MEKIELTFFFHLHNLEHFQGVSHSLFSLSLSSLSPLSFLQEVIKEVFVDRMVEVPVEKVRLVCI